MEPSSQTESFFLPPAASTVAGHVDSLYYFIHYISVFFFVLIIALMFYFVVKYRRRPDGPKVKQISHNTALEVTWSVIPTILLIVIFWWGFRGYIDMVIAPRDSVEVLVTGRKWSWTFTHPSGVTDAALLKVPVSTPIKLVMSSEDVIHSFFVPDFRVKQDVVPGRYTTLWFEATHVGKYQVFCTEYCGTAHSDMLAQVEVVTDEEYKKYLETASDVEPTAEAGAKLYEKFACVTCHTLDGSAKVGPSFKGLFGKSENIVGAGAVPVDENYLRESILEPNAKVVQGFPAAMPTFKGTLNDKQITALIEFIKAQK